MKNPNNWRELIIEHLEEHGLTWSDVIKCSLSDDEINQKFDNSYGCTEARPFYAWTETRVLFSWEYDGMVGVRSAPRNPSDEKPDWA